MPAWLLTNTFYGQWLPGDDTVDPSRSVRVHRTTLYRPRVEHDVPGTDVEPPRRGLNLASKRLMTSEPVEFNLQRAEILFAQFQETAEFRKRPLWAAAIMWNHFHMVVHAPDDPEPDRMLGDFKAYGSRALNRSCSRDRTTLVAEGSKRKLPDDAAVIAAIRYVTDETAALGLVAATRKNRLNVARRFRHRSLTLPARWSFEKENLYDASPFLCSIRSTLVASPVQAAEARKPNVVYFIIDELGYYELSGMGHPEHQTPNIDRLMADGDAVHAMPGRRTGLRRRAALCSPASTPGT